jgi:FKBP-type peptidyl-prolyl cis-trans isomerase
MFRTTALRRLAPVALLAASTLVLASCGSDGDSKDKTSSTDKTSSSSSPSPTTDANGCGTFTSGKTSEGVKVSGDFGQKQTATFSTPLKATSLERTVLDEGTGEKTKSGQTLDVLVSVYLGKDGKALGSQQVSLTPGDSQMIQAFTAGVDCVPIGSRVVVTAPAKDMYGEEGNSQLGITAEDSLVIVSDVIGEKKQVVPEAWKKDLPKVTFAADGKPTLKLPGGKEPADLLLKVLKPGDGDVVKAGDTVTLDYQGTNWRTGKIFDESYGKQPASFATDQVVEGFGAALVGQKVGTRLVVSIPPKYGYGETGNEQAGIKGTDTIVFVLEIKATAAS